MPEKTILLEMDLISNEHLHSPEGQLKAIAFALRELAEISPKPELLAINAVFPQKTLQDEMFKNITKLNNAIKPRGGLAGIADKAANLFLMTQSGVKSKLKPIEIDISGSKMLMKMDVSVISAQDLRKLADFLEKNCEKLSKL